jgi:hypothetical protein
LERERGFFQTSARGIPILVGHASLSGNQTGSTERNTFYEWLARLSIYTTVGEQHGQWYAVATDFSVVGMGATKQDACADLTGALESYLRSIYDEQREMQSAWRPLSTIRRLRMLLPLKHRTRLVLPPIVH